MRNTICDNSSIWIDNWRTVWVHNKDEQKREKERKGREKNLEEFY